MTASDASCDFLYVHTDIPEGMTIRQWRARRAADRPTQHRWRLPPRAAAGGVSRATARTPSPWLRIARVSRDWRRASGLCRAAP
jgi:hypothetical protein